MRRRLILGARPLLLGAVILVAPLGVAAAVLRESDARDEPQRAVPREPVLGVRAPSRPREVRPRSAERDRPPVVVDTLRPGQKPDVEVGSDRGPPRRIAKENVTLRRELAHLKALQAERRRVSRTLTSVSTGDGRLLVGSGRLIWPISGPLTSPFGQRWGRLHAGVDISAPAGTPIRAADSGRVALAGWQGGYGLYTCVQHTATLSTCYAHQSRLGTTPGASVQQGQVIGYVGNTGYSFGDHLHFETWVGGRPVDPLDFL